jgi:hypothetical protein
MDGSDVFEIARYCDEPMYPPPSGRVPSNRWICESITGIEFIHAGTSAATSAAKVRVPENAIAAPAEAAVLTNFRRVISGIDLPSTQSTASVALKAW